MTKVTFQMAGMRELQRALADELPRAVAKNVLKRSGIAVMRKHIEGPAKARAPRDRGRLADGIDTQPVKAKRGAGGRYARSDTIEIATGPTGRPEGGNASWQENGTVDSPAQPYMRPTADEGGPLVIADIRDEMASQIDKSRARIARKAARQK